MIPHWLTNCKSQQIAFNRVPDFFFLCITALCQFLTVLVMGSMKANFVKYPTHWNFLKDLWRSLSLCCRADSPYRNVLLFFPYGDTRGHSGLPVCWTVLVSTVRRVQSITYNNRNNSMCHRETKRE